jgi:hypothetical protein
VHALTAGERLDVLKDRSFSGSPGQPLATVEKFSLGAEKNLSATASSEEKMPTTALRLRIPS